MLNEDNNIVLDHQQLWGKIICKTNDKIYRLAFEIIHAQNDNIDNDDDEDDDDVDDDENEGRKEIVNVASNDMVHAAYNFFSSYFNGLHVF